MNHNFPQVEYRLPPLSEFVVTERIEQKVAPVVAPVDGDVVDADFDELPNGLYMRDGKPHFSCWGCDLACEWEVDVALYDCNARESNVGGCSDRCIP